MKGILFSITLLSSSLMAMQGPSATAMQDFMKACETPVVIVEKSLKEKASDLVQAGYTATKPYAQKGVTMARSASDYAVEFYQHPTESLKNVGTRVSTFNAQHPGLIIKITGGIVGAYVVYKAIRWLFSKKPVVKTGKTAVCRMSATAPRKPGEQNPKLAAFQATLKK